MISQDVDRIEQTKKWRPNHCNWNNCFEGTRISLQPIEEIHELSKTNIFVYPGYQFKIVDSHSPIFTCQRVL